ncbi:MAG: hypothetical protein QOD83_2570 [Solirubrobacteraceae bacterium]|jgi:hypothetical protein|nr:hypothetical protein [Solirubrobacteraceae bacterium]MEA2182777.1 hypothetical protein [Solirubrobacteraceae bacterium]MEA2187782.1 hypothetical protein [Solirubrobacteraceae bacterium]MEA2232754.1 hypothetical protein [Solirubrobacteraceae bacterium]
MIGDTPERVGIVLTILFVIVVIALNPSLSGVGYAFLVIVGACSIWLVRVLYLNEVNRRRDE